MLVFPTCALGIYAKDVDFDLPSLSGGRSLSGIEDRIFPTGGAIWFADLPDVSLTSRERVLLWRAFKAATNGGADPFIFPICDARHQPSSGKILVPFSDGATFSDDTMFAQYDLVTGTSSGAALRSTEIQIDILGATDTLIGGERFSIKHATWSHRAYQVGQVLEQTDTTARLQFHPPLREAVPAGTPVDFVNPRFVARIDSQYSAPLVNPKFSRAEARFVEDMKGVYN